MTPWKFALARLFRRASANPSPRTNAPARFRPAVTALEDRTVPSADFFADATLLSGSLVTDAGSNVGATAEAGEPAEATSGTINSVWWKWTAPESGTVEVNTIGSDFDTVLGVYSGSTIDGLTLQAANDDAYDSQSQLTFHAVAGTTYFIAVDGFADTTGNIVLNLGTTPANDDFANATVVAGGTVTGANLAAGGEAGEPNGGTSDPVNTVWWSWTPTTSGEVEITTVGSDFDTVLSVYTGTAVDSLTLVAANDDYQFPNTLASRVAFHAAAGKTYFVAVDGYLNETGHVVLNLPPAAPPANSAPVVADQGFNVSENAPAGTVVGTVAASDPDAGQTLTYAIVGGNTSGAFAIDAATGVVTVANPAALDSEVTPSFALVVRVTDSAAEPLSSDAVVTVNLTNVNEAPVLDNTGSMALNPINMGQANNNGTLVADLLASAGGNRISDPDAGALRGIAIVAADTRNGRWEFSTDNGATWRSLGAVSGGSARLLAADAVTRVRFVPSALYFGTVTNGLTFRAWDQTYGFNGGLADTTVNGGSSAFSTATETASIRVKLLGLL